MITTVYRTDDGSIFEDYDRAVDYEFAQDHVKGMAAVEMYDEAGRRISNILTSDAYENAATIVVLDEFGVNLIQELGVQGFCCYEQIDHPGVWVWNDGTYIEEVEG